VSAVEEVRAGLATLLLGTITDGRCEAQLQERIDGLASFAEALGEEGAEPEGPPLRIWDEPQ
jgi:hypothetical protein